MATYKVPQDVEADDKLIGPFSFRQFIYLIIVALAIALAWGLSNIFVGLDYSFTGNFTLRRTRITTSERPADGDLSCGDDFVSLETTHKVMGSGRC
jgi:hypothetical protein